LIAVSLIFLLIVNGTKFPIGNIYLLIYKIHPTLQVLRNPYEKFGGVFYLNFFVLWGIGLWLIWLKLSKFLGGIFFFLSLIWLVISGWPVVNGLVFTYKYKVNSDPKVGFRVKIPDYYSQVNELLGNTKHEFRGIALPMSGEGIKHRWEYGYDGVESYNGLFNYPFISLNTTVHHLPEIASTIESATVPELLRLTSRVNVDYILVRDDIYIPVSSRDPKEVRQDFSNYLLGRPISKLTIFDVPEGNRGSRIYATNRIVYSNIVNFSNLLDLGDDTRSALVETDTSSESFEFNDFILVPNFIVDDLEFKEPTHPDNAIKTLPHSSYLPNHPLYFLVKIKEKFWIMSSLYDSEAISITLAGKRLKEVTMVANSFDEKLLSSALEDYFKYVEPVISKARSQIQENNVSAPGGVEWWEIFWYHSTALEKLLSSSTSENRPLILNAKDRLDNLLSLAGINPLYESILKQFSSSHIIKRMILSVPEDGEYELRVKIGVKGMEPLTPIQIDQDLVDVEYNYDNKDLVFKTRLTLKRGIHELRVGIPFRKTKIQTPELIFDTSDLDGDRDVREWTFDLPYGSGEAALIFKYRIIQGLGPRVSLLNRENQDFDSLGKRNYASDGYYFDWIESYNSVRFDRDVNKLTVEISSLPVNNCESVNRKNRKCDDEEFRKKYDRRSKFLAEDFRLVVVPSSKIVFSLNKKQTDRVDLVETPQISWQKMNPSLYKIKVTENDSLDNVLVFSDQFHSGWKLFPVKSEGWNEEELKRWDLFDATELSNKRTFLDSLRLILKTLGIKPLNEDKHFTVNGFANGWNLPEKNSDWVLLFTPERGLYLGWTVTILTTLIFVLISFTIASRKIRKDEDLKTTNKDKL
jgi:hypothetical protein